MSLNSLKVFFAARKQAVGSGLMCWLQAGNCETLAMDCRAIDLVRYGRYLQRRKWLLITGMTDVFVAPRDK